MQRISHKKRVLERVVEGNKKRTAHLQASEERGGSAPMTGKKCTQWKLKS